MARLAHILTIATLAAACNEDGKVVPFGEEQFTIIDAVRIPVAADASLLQMWNLLNTCDYLLGTPQVMPDVIGDQDLFVLSVSPAPDEGLVTGPSATAQVTDLVEGTTRTYSNRNAPSNEIEALGGGQFHVLLTITHEQLAPTDFQALPEQIGIDLIVDSSACP